MSGRDYEVKKSWCQVILRDVDKEYDSHFNQGECMDKQKEYRITYIDEQGVPRKATIFAFNMKPVLSTFFTHFPLSTNVTAIQLVSSYPETCR